VPDAGAPSERSHGNVAGLDDDDEVMGEGSVRLRGRSGQWLSTRQIVEELHISQHTVQEHLTAAFDKLGVRSRRELVATMLAGPPG
jgi:Bacterial regulatory proteins, luxR family